MRSLMTSRLVKNFFKRVMAAYDNIALFTRKGIVNLVCKQDVPKI